VNNNVLIVHSGDWIGIARLPAVLRAGGARVTVMAPPGTHLIATRHADEKIAVPAALDELVEALRVHLRERCYRWVIVADDPLLNALAERSPDEPWIADILPLPDPSSLEMLASKIAFLDRCRAAGLPIAASENVATAEGALLAAATIGYPVMLKLATGSGGKGVKRIDTAVEMRRAFDAFAAGRLITVERFVEGRICGCETLFDHGRPVCWSPFFKFRCYPQFGPSAVRMLYAHPQLPNIVQKLGALTRFHGFATFCFIHDETRDELILLELNFRPGTGMHLRGPVYTMFAAGVAAVLDGRLSTGRETHGLHGHIVSLFPQDFERVLAEKDYRYLLWSVLRGTFLSDIPFTDPTLLFCQLQALAREWLPEPLRTVARVVKHGMIRIFSHVAVGQAD
jgi:biotin carboxylase